MDCGVMAGNHRCRPRTSGIFQHGRQIDREQQEHQALRQEHAGHGAGPGQQHGHMRRGKARVDPAKRGRQAPLRPMAKRLREKVSASAFIDLTMERVAAPTIRIVAAGLPIATRAASSSGALLAANPAGPTRPSAVAATVA
jgi:hypothetical protein